MAIYGLTVPEPSEITYQKRLGIMLKDLENEGFNLYYDEKTKEWECMNKESDLYVVGLDKFAVIQDAWRQIMVG